MTYLNWHRRIEEIREWQVTTLVSPQEFDAKVRDLVSADSPISDVRFQVRSESNVHIEAKATDCATFSDSHRFPMKGQAVECVIEFNRKDQSTIHDQSVGTVLPSFLNGFFDSYWKTQYRDVTTRLYDMKQPGAIGLVDVFISRSLDGGNIVGCAFLDGDHFGSINKEFGQEVGDGIISKVGYECMSMSSELDCIVVHDGGDEFGILAAVSNRHEFVDTVMEIYRRIKGINIIAPNNTPLSFSAGVTFQEANDHLQGYAELIKAAESALMRTVNGGREKQRGTISFADSSERGTIDRDYCLLETRCRLGNRRPFTNVWMNAISRRTRSALQSSEDPSICVAQVVSDGGLAPSSEICANFSTTDRICGKRNLNIFDVALSIFHGIGIYRLSIDDVSVREDVFFTQDAGVAKVRCSELGVIIPQVFVDKSCESLKLGVIPKLNSAFDPKDIGRSLQVALLVHIGEAPKDLLALPFYDCVFVDDRPTKGGELPDFYEHAISRLLYLLRENPNIQKVYCWGNHNCAIKTVEVLEQISNGSVDIVKLADTVGWSESEVTGLCQRVKGKVTFASAKSVIIKDYLSASAQIGELLPQRIAEKASSPKLARVLSENRYRLQIHEGFCATSIAEAYPLALEILRDSNNVDFVNDRYDHYFHELTDFKIVLQHPRDSEEIPYNNIVREDLEQYYQRAFGDTSNSLFGRRLRSQVTPFLDELRCGVSGAPGFTSRRAILVVPNRVIKGVTDPLGLISVRASVAHIEDKYVLRFGYYWRTVEALIGLPYSLYASARHANHLSRCLKSVANVDVAVTRLVYVASSLHISSEASVLDVAKRVVDSASR